MYYIYIHIYRWRGLIEWLDRKNLASKGQSHGSNVDVRGVWCPQFRIKPGSLQLQRGIWWRFPLTGVPPVIISYWFSMNHPATFRGTPKSVWLFGSQYSPDVAPSHVAPSFAMSYPNKAVRPWGMGVSQLNLHHRLMFLPTKYKRCVQVGRFFRWSTFLGMASVHFFWGGLSLDLQVSSCGVCGEDEHPLVSTTLMGKKKVKQGFWGLNVHYSPLVFYVAIILFMLAFDVI